MVSRFLHDTEPDGPGRSFEQMGYFRRTPVFRDHNAGHDALVVSEEEEACRAYRCDGSDKGWSVEERRACSFGHRSRSLVSDESVRLRARY